MKTDGRTLKRKLTLEERRQIKRDRNWTNAADEAKKYGVSVSSINRARRETFDD